MYFVPLRLHWYVTDWLEGILGASSVIEVTIASALIWQCSPNTSGDLVLMNDWLLLSIQVACRQVCIVIATYKASVKCGPMS